MTRSRFLKLAGSLLLAPLALLLAGCDVHEYPANETGGDPMSQDLVLDVTLNFDYEIPQYQILTYNMDTFTSKARSDEYPDGVYPYRARYTVQLFPISENGLVATTPEKTYTYIGAFVTNLKTTVSFTLAPKRYRIAAFVDFVDKETQLNTFYDPADFRAISIIENPYTGNTDFRDAFIGTADVDLTTYQTSGARVSGSVDMHRPVAKFRFVATDPAEYEALHGKTDFSKFTAMFYYNGFVPSVYDLFSNDPTDSATRLSFKCNPYVDPDTGEVEVGFDYILVGGRETSVDVTVTLYEASGKAIGSGRIAVPLKADGLTTVNGKFLTGVTTGGIGINPDFDGEINIYF